MPSARRKKFSEVAPVTGVVLTKLDGTAKGGVVLSVHEELHVPVKWVGVGEAVEDLQPFNAREFAERFLKRMEIFWKRIQKPERTNLSKAVKRRSGC